MKKQSNFEVKFMIANSAAIMASQLMMVFVIVFLCFFAKSLCVFGVEQLDRYFVIFWCIAVALTVSGVLFMRLVLRYRLVVTYRTMSMIRLPLAVLATLALFAVLPNITLGAVFAPTLFTIAIWVIAACFCAHLLVFVLMLNIERIDRVYKNAVKKLSGKKIGDDSARDYAEEFEGLFNNDYKGVFVLLLVELLGVAGKLCYADLWSISDFFKRYGLLWQQVYGVAIDYSFIVCLSVVVVSLLYWNASTVSQLWACALTLCVLSALGIPSINVPMFIYIFSKTYVLSMPLYNMIWAIISVKLFFFIACAALFAVLVLWYKRY